VSAAVGEEPTGGGGRGAPVGEELTAGGLADTPSRGFVVIAIDGPAGSGKSTVARQLARRLGLDYLDTGAMYRSVAFAALRRGIDPADREPVAHLAQQVTIEVGERVLVDGADATAEIRGTEVTTAVSVVAANPGVRSELRARQRSWARDHRGGVVEGRDIATVVFPDAVLKVYLTAEDSERARRRHQETAPDADASSVGPGVEGVRAELARRDRLDSTRASSPLAVANDAALIDTTNRRVDDIVDEIMARLPLKQAPGSEVGPAVAASPLAPVEVGNGLQGVELAPVGASPPAARHDKSWLGDAVDRALYRSLRVAILGFARVYWQLEVRGAENLPGAGAYVVAPVHRSNVDTPLVALISRRRLRFMGKDSLWRTRAGARLFSALGAFPVHRGSADRDALRRCIEVIDGGEPLVLFPEGTRQSGPLVHPLFEGAAYVAARTGVPVVPIGIGGSERAMPKGAKGVWPVKIAIVVGAPLYPPPPAPGAEGRRRSRREVRDLTARLHHEIQVVFDAAQVMAGAG